jgi:uncharacterized protein YigE (DUF2233 family)
MTNGGMFHSDFSPVGLLIINGKPKSKLNTQNPNNKENFYLLPNGLFYITPSGEGKVMETHTFKNQDPAIPIKFASQSGPMLLVNDKPNPNFVFKSDNDKIRSGVGEMKDGKLVFIVSEEPVNFYDFTLLFKHRYGCKNALFLDGAISEGYINTGMRTNISNRNFGSVISICRKR